MSNNRFRFNKQYEQLPETNVIGGNSDLSHIYYNIQIYNNTSNYDISGNPLYTLTAVSGDFSEQRVSDILMNPSLYTASVTYFHLDSNTIPCQVVQPILNQNYLDLQTSPNGFEIEGFPTIYSFYLQVEWYTRKRPFNKYHTSSTTGVVYWKPLDTTISKPSQPTSLDSINKTYFYNYSFDYFLNLLNNSIAYHMDVLVNGDSVDYPYFVHNSDTGLISFDTPLTFQTDNEGNCKNLNSNITNVYNWKIYVNKPLYNLLAGSNYLENPLPNFDGYQLLSEINSDTSNIIIQQVNSVATNYIRNTQEYVSTLLWNPCASIVFTTPNFTVVNDLNAKPVIDGTNPYVSNSSNADVLNILFEYYIGRRNDITINNFTRAEYRLLDLLSINPIRQLIIRTFWKDEFGQLNPLFLESGAGMNMKILFRKKAFN